MLQFIQHKTRNRQHPVHKTGARNIRDAPVNNHARVEQNYALGRMVAARRPIARVFARKTPAEKIENIAFAHDHDPCADIAKHNQRNERQDIFERFGQERERKCRQRGDNQPDDETDGRGNELLRGNTPYLSPKPTVRANGQPRRNQQPKRRAGEKQYQNESNVTVGLCRQRFANAPSDKSKHDHANQTKDKFD